MTISTKGKRPQGNAARANGVAARAKAAAIVVPSGYFRWKYTFERCLAAVFLLPGLLIMAVLVPLVRLTSPGPAIFRQIRVGRNGRTFLMYKIRTMRNDAEAATGPVWARAGDPRVTPLGRVLRKLHLDEFPQLFNVLRGEMALIGPRPERPEFSQHLTLKIPHYQERLTVLPGITGLAQINLPPDTDLDSVRRKLTLDLEYIATARFLLDLRMFMCTAVRLVGIHGELAMRMFALKRNVQPSTSEHDVAECNEAPVISTSGPVHGLHSDHKPATVNGESASYSNGNSHNGHTSVGGARPGAVFSGDAAP